MQLGGDDGRQLTKRIARRQEPTRSSQGYACEKPSRLDFYQNASRAGSTQPLRRRPDGSHEEIDWDTAIREVAERFAVGSRQPRWQSRSSTTGAEARGTTCPAPTPALQPAAVLGSALPVQRARAGEDRRVLGRGTEMLGAHDALRFRATARWRSSWARTRGTRHSDPARARVTLKEIAKDPERQDDRDRSASAPKTAELADIHLQVRPGTDAWLLAALIGVMLEEDLDRSGLHRGAHRPGFEAVLPAPSADEMPVLRLLRARAGVDEDAGPRGRAARSAGAESTAIFEDLGVQMNRHSTLVSYLHRLVWLPHRQLRQDQGAHYIPTRSSSRSPAARGARRQSPVVGAPIISGLVPCNTIPEEILTDHPESLSGDAGREPRTRRTHWPTAPHARGAARHSTASW